MKIGILTFHSQLNYGGVLQCYALQHVLTEMGHDVVVLDRRFDDVRSLDANYFNASAKRKVLWLGAWFCGSNALARWIRAVRTDRFLKNHLHLTKYHFIKWCEAPRELGVDVIVVGSDQVWHCGNWGDPKPYLLEDAPRVPAIAYAASMGLEHIPAEWRTVFERGLRRFAAISVRERRTQELVGTFQVPSRVVLDPTLLVPTGAWDRLAGRMRQKKRKLVCYFVDGSESLYRDALECYARQCGCSVEVFVHLQRVAPIGLSPVRLLRHWKRRLTSRVRFMYTADPADFVRSCKSADAIVADSFHALMFSAIFGKNVRILRPEAAWLSISFSRIQEFVSAYAQGPILANSLNDALTSLLHGETVRFDYTAIERCRQDCLSWLNENLRKIKGCHHGSCNHD